MKKRSKPVAIWDRPATSPEGFCSGSSRLQRVWLSKRLGTCTTSQQRINSRFGEKSGTAGHRALTFPSGLSTHRSLAMGTAHLTQNEGSMRILTLLLRPEPMRAQGRIKIEKVISSEQPKKIEETQKQFKAKHIDHR